MRCRAANVLRTICFCFLKGTAHGKLKVKKLVLTKFGISSRSKGLVWAPLKHQWPHQAKEFHVIIKITQTCQQTLNTQNVKLASLNVNHLTFRSPPKVTRRCKVCLKSAPNQRPAHVGLNSECNISGSECRRVFKLCTWPETRACRVNGL